MLKRAHTVFMVGLLLLVGTACGSAAPAAPPTSRPAAEPTPAVTSVAQAPTSPTAKPASSRRVSDVDACALVTPAEAEAILGALKAGEPKREDSPLLQSGCTFSTQQGHQTIIELDDGEKGSPGRTSSWPARISSASAAWAPRRTAARDRPEALSLPSTRRRTSWTSSVWVATAARIRPPGCSPRRRSAGSS